MMRPSLIGLLLVLAASGCISHDPKTGARSTARADWIAWQAKRRESVAGTNGWATLVGLHWLRPGRNTAGGNPTNDVAFPQNRAVANVGSFFLNGRDVRFDAAPGIVATVAGKVVTSVDFQSDVVTNPTKLQLGPLSVIVIERGDRIGLRVRDPDAPTRVHFHELEYFPYDPTWRIEGRFEPFHPVQKLRVQDVTGGIEEYPAPGMVVFPYQGVEHHLEVVEEPDETNYFVIFRDRTAGNLTYHSGRFLYVARPDAQGHVVIDFNRAYNPPCAFTPFATCPLPPRQNWLPFAVEAGERKPSGHH